MPISIAPIIGAKGIAHFSKNEAFPLFVLMINLNEFNKRKISQQRSPNPLRTVTAQFYINPSKIKNWPVAGS
ncbi:hypothetical protein IQ267_05885 [filamentous cyanobacterium LEGE 07170]|nr:hypothetical protein [filamentous cyanobacterium LEGE 07170]